MDNFIPWDIHRDHCSKNQIKLVKDKINIAILIAGTVDPGNMHEDTFEENPFLFKRAQSYNDPAGRYESPFNKYENPFSENSYLHKLTEGTKDIFDQIMSRREYNWYWGENEDMLESLRKIKEEYNNFHIFEAHGWSGDNGVTNREIAGSYLADRLCGGNGESAYYKGHLNKHVSFHLIGHSHGGNVINEFTKRIAELEEWPDIWKIKSITYLSTPFFQELHQVNTQKFHKDCNVINVFNKFDLTQRTIADFSLYQLVEASRVFKKSDVKDYIKAIKSFDFEMIKKHLSAFPKPTGVKYELAPIQPPIKPPISILPSSPLKIPKISPKIEWFMGRKDGRSVYSEFIKLFDNLIDLITEINKVLDTINEGYLPGKGIISEGTKTKINLELSLLQQPVKETRHNFEERVKEDKFPVHGFFEDLNFDNFVRTLFDLIRIDRNTLSGNLTDLLYKVFNDIIEVFDDTLTTPYNQFEDTDFKDSIIEFDITSEDTYLGLRDEIYSKFIKLLEKDEKDYHNTRSKESLLSIIFTLAAQLESVQDNLKTLNSWSSTLESIIKVYDAKDAWSRLRDPKRQLKRIIGKEKKNIYRERFKELNDIFKSYLDILNNRSFGNMVIKDTIEPKRGSLDYLMRVSHSISRMFFHRGVEQLFKQQLDTKLKKDM